MAAGKNSPIVKALTIAERKTSGEIRVHLSRRLIEKDPLGRGLALFDEYKMTQTANRNAVLIYVNLRCQRFAIIADEGIHRAVGQMYWEELAVNLKEDLLSTYFENAISLTIFTLGVTLQKYFPVDV
ncbi:MAG: TPM domain-containing protein [Methylotenera sp.]|nr:TPM domain-containing protein [Oligoflexia bacterium]